MVCKIKVKVDGSSVKHIEKNGQKTTQPKDIAINTIGEAIYPAINPLHIIHLNSNASKIEKRDTELDLNQIIPNHTINSF